MKHAGRIFLVGFMGSGKTTLGRALSESLGFDFVDTDEEIEKKEGRTIANIFAIEGEAYFREQESKILKKLLLRKNVVIATGGGVPCFQDNMEEIKKGGISFFLKVDAKTLLQRLKGETNQRPLLNDKEDEELLFWMEEKIKERNFFYSQANFILDGDSSLEELIIQIKKIINRA